ncbi:S8 family serine peptidase [Variovorax sp. J22R24]|uniref:S8 family serine peptidase n=1 Tax=Variovorax gracilis TaxID=3053502 RepID=UPI0025780C58|nr:S8 family serine peptidase [Variovorax sp. J22R24]MDM0109871.1 S8 family serine peptidase [Variovorax sp. J22R24]
MATLVDVQLIEGLGLPYAPGAETNLLDGALDPLFNTAWQAFVAQFPGQTLLPLFDELPVEQLADLVDGARISGDEPPNPFVWFTLSVDDADVDAVLLALLALPMVVSAGPRPAVFLPNTVSYGTNPRAAEGQTFQIRPSPIGVDAIYAWQIAGGAGDNGRVGDIESGWRLNHEELITQKITRRSVFGVEFEINHGTGVAGILVGADNGVGTVGIVPNAELELFSETRSNGIPSFANAIAVAAASLTAGDVLLLEGANNFFAGGNAPDILVEFDPAVQLQIRLAVGRGITVIEPAGNGGIDLDAFPFLAHTRPESPTFSGAVVVGSATDTAPVSGTWFRRSSFGSRVDCFAADSQIQSPDFGATDAYRNFGGTSGASAIVAGVATSLQSMIKAANNGGILPPADVRRFLSSATLGTLPQNPLGAKIGPMPDLRRITRALGLQRILPVGAAAIGGNALLIVHLDADNRIVRRHFTLLTGWGQPLPTPTSDGSTDPSDLFALTAAQPAVTSTDETNPIPRLVHDAFFSGRQGIHSMFWDSLNQSGNVVTPIAPITATAQGKALAAVRPSELRVVLAGISPAGRLVFLTGDSQILHSNTSTPVVIDAVASYRRVAGPAMVSRGVGLADIVAVEDGGALNWYTGAFPGIGGGFTGPVTEASAVACDPGARPALMSTGSLLLAAAVSIDGSLRAFTIDPALLTMDVPVEVDATVSIARLGPIGLGRTAANAVIAAVDAQNVVRAATRPLSGGTWTPLIPLLSLVPISQLGGVTLVSIDLGVMAIAIGTNGVICSALTVDGVLWSPLVPLP